MSIKSVWLRGRYRRPNVEPIGMHIPRRFISVISAAALLATGSPSAGEEGRFVSTSNLSHKASIPYKGGSDLEFLTRNETETRQVITYKTVRTKRVSCRARGVRCRRGQRFKIVRIRPRRVAVRTTVNETVRKSYMLAGSLSSFAPGQPVGLRIIDITNPNATKVTSFYTCQSNQLDIQTFQRGDRSYVVLGLDYGPSGTSAQIPSACHADRGLPKNSLGVLIVDVTDEAAPRSVGFAHVPAGAHNSTLHPGGRYLYVSDSELEGPLTRNDERLYATSRIQIVDLADVTAPRMVKEIDVVGWGSSHDITFSQDGSRAYSAALTQTNIFDTSDPMNPRLVTAIVDPEINLHHQSEPYRLDGRNYLVITDELAGAAGNGYCPGGGLHIYDITNELVPVKMSRFVVPAVTTLFDEQRWFICTSHVLKIYPEQRVMTIAWYTAGLWVIDISNPLGYRAVGFADPTGIDGRQTEVWSAKMHEGHIYTNDLLRGVDVFSYSGPANEVTMADGLSAYAGLSRPQGARTVDFTPRADDGRPLFCFEVAAGRSLI